jgi:hypothetical protein
MADADGQAWFAAHKARAENLIWLFYAVAALSVIALIAPVKWQRSSIALASTVLVLGVLAQEQNPNELQVPILGTHF